MRGKQAPKRIVVPDSKYNSTTITKFVNKIMKNGKKSTAQRVVYGALDVISEKTKSDPLEVFETALQNVGPALEVRGRRIGGANYQIPYPVSPERKLALAMRWILEAVRSRKGSAMAEKLAQELIDASTNQGTAIKKREDVHKMAEANRAFAHFA